jgi:hypothetical protein
VTLSNPNVGSTQIPIPLSRTGGCGSPISRNRDSSREEDGNSEARVAYGDNNMLSVSVARVSRGMLSFTFDPKAKFPPESGRTGEVFRF